MNNVRLKTAYYQEDFKLIEAGKTNSGYRRIKRRSLF